MVRLMYQIGASATEGQLHALWEAHEASTLARGQKARVGWVGQETKVRVGRIEERVFKYGIRYVLGMDVKTT